MKFFNHIHPVRLQTSNEVHCMYTDRRPLREMKTAPIFLIKIKKRPAFCFTHKGQDNN